MARIYRTQSKSRIDILASVQELAHSAIWHERRIVRGRFLWYGNRKAHAMEDYLNGPRSGSVCGCVKPR